MPPTQEQAPSAGIPWRSLLAKAAKFIIITALFGWLYGWASPKCFHKDESAGFAWGMLHGALMPMALPALVMGQDVEIYATNNSGRLYKLGYIVGINLCGVVFFGSIFWTPARKRPRPIGENGI